MIRPPVRPLAGLRWRAVHWGWAAAQRAGAVTAGTPAARRFAEFEARLASAGVPVTVRDTRGREIDGACGQLAASASQV